MIRNEAKSREKVEKEKNTRRKNENYTLFPAQSIDYCVARVSPRRIASAAFPSKTTPTTSKGRNENRI